ncbi:uncharacterized protein JCM15063_005814 [Sporobolomyces koalae]|uniref:uncharacterized protein n=1 Tax=Sporobolomyces koalae TaxID=500713 RepID=UPI0031701987
MSLVDAPFELDAFLGSIGASSLSAQLAGPAPRGPAAAVHDRIQQELDSVNDETLDLIKREWTTLNDQLDQGHQVLVKLQQEQEQLAALELELDGPDAFLPPLVSHLESHQSLLTSHAESRESVLLLSALVSLHTTISQFSTSITSGHLYPDGLDHLKRAIQALEQGAPDWIEQTPTWKQFVKWHHDEQTRFESSLENTFESAFDFAAADPATRHRLTMQARLRSSREATKPDIGVQEVLHALEDFAAVTGNPSKVESLVQRVAKQVLRNFVAPFLDANGTRTWSDDDDPEERRKVQKLAFEYSESPEEQRYIVTLVPSTSSHADHDPISDLSRFLTFFTSHSSLFSPASRFTSILTSSLTPSIQSYLISSHLVPSLPSITTHLAEYIALLQRSTIFESEFLPSVDLFAFLPPTGSAGSALEESHIVSTWAKGLPHHFARKLGERALARVRTQVQRWDWGQTDGGEMVEVEVREEEEMEGLLRGLELGLDQLDDDDNVLSTSTSLKETRSGKQVEKRRTELETVPRGAKREMTLEEALAPRPVRAVTPPPPPPPPAAPAVEILQKEEPFQLAAPPAAVARGGKKLKLGAAKITKPILPPSSPSPPPMFQGDDMLLATPNVPPIATSQSLEVQQQTRHLRSASQTSIREGNGTPILSPRPISIPSAASFTHADTDDEQHEIVERAQRAIAQQGSDLFEPLEEIKDIDNGGQGVEMLIPPRNEHADDLNDHETQIKVEEEFGTGFDHEIGETLGGNALTAEALEQQQQEHRQEFSEEDVKPFIKEESLEPELQPIAVQIIEPDVEHEIKQEVKQEDDEERGELEMTPQFGDYEPTPQPPAREVEPENFYEQEEEKYSAQQQQFYGQSSLPAEENSASYDSYAAQNQYGYSNQEQESSEPQLYQPHQEQVYPSEQEGYQVEDATPLQMDHASNESPYAVEEPAHAPHETTYEHRQTEVAPEHSVHAPASYQPYQPPAPEPEPPRMFSPPVPPPPPAAYQAPEAYSQDYSLPPPRSDAAPPPPRANPITAPPPPRSTMSPVTAPPPRISPNQMRPPPRSQGSLSPNPMSQLRPQSPAIAPQHASAPSPTSPYAPPPPRGPARPVSRPQTVLSPPPSSTQPARASPAPYARQPGPPPITSPFGTSVPRSVISPRPPSRNHQDGPILNHIQQRFVSPPPSHVNPYTSFPVPTSASASGGSSYIPANDPLLADLFGSNKNSNVSPASTSFFTPDPPGRQQRSNSSSSSQSQQGMYRPSSRGSQQQHQQSYAPPPPHQQQQYYPQSGWAGQPQQEVEEVIDDRYSYGYGQQQAPMRLRGGAYSDDSEESDESEDKDEEIEFGVMRLRGGATLDLGEMDEDEGSKSGDDWGFGDDNGLEEGGEEEDAWGFGDDEIAPAPPTPSPPIFRNPPPVPTVSKPAAVTSPVRQSFSPPTSPIRHSVYDSSPARHVPSASISSITSQTSALSRPPSYSFSSTLAPPVSHPELEPALEEDDDSGEGDDAWGFDEELETESPPAADEAETAPAEATETVEVEAASQPERAEVAQQTAVAEAPEATPVSPTAHEAPRLATPEPEVVHEVGVVSSDVLPPVSLQSKLAPVEETLLSETAQEPAPSSAEEVDEWGFGETPEESEVVEEEPNHELRDSVPPPEDQERPQDIASLNEPTSEQPSPAEALADPASSTIITRSEDLKDQDVPEQSAVDNDEQAVETTSEILPEGPVVVNEFQPELSVPDTTIEDPEQLPTETPALDDAEEGYSIESSGWGLEEQEEPVERPYSPVATPALETAEEGHNETDGWDLDEPTFDEPSIEVGGPPIDLNHESTVVPAATPALDDAESGHAINSDSSALTEPRVDEEDVPPNSTPALELAEGQEYPNQPQDRVEAEAPEEVEEDAPRSDIGSNDASTQLASPVNVSEALKSGADDVLDEPSVSEFRSSDGPVNAELDRSASPEASTPAEAPSDSLSPDAEPTDSSELEETVEALPSESLLTAPAETLEDVSFPVEPVSPLLNDPVSAAGLEEDGSPAPMTSLPTPLPHSDLDESSHIAIDALEEAVEEPVAAPADDAALLDLEAADGEDEEAGWGLEAEEEEAVNSGLVSQEAFKPDEQASQREEQELPVENTLFEPTPVDAAEQSRRSSVDDTPLSPPHSDTVLVEPMSSSNSSGTTNGERSMSSPEVIDKADAWGFESEQGEGGAGAEVLGVDDHKTPLEEESAVQHELERPILHDESTVQHIDDRPVVEPTSAADVNIAATMTRPQEHTFSIPAEALPEPSAEPYTWDESSHNEEDRGPDAAEHAISRSASPSPATAASPLPQTEDDATADDPWDLDLEESTQIDDQATPNEALTPIPQTSEEEATKPAASDPSWASFDDDNKPSSPASLPSAQPAEDSIETVAQASRAHETDAQAQVPEIAQQEFREPSPDNQEDEGWGWDESAEREASPAPLGQTDSAKPGDVQEGGETGIAAPLLEAASAVSALAVGAASAFGLSTQERSPSPPTDSGPQRERSASPLQSATTANADVQTFPGSERSLDAQQAQGDHEHTRAVSDASAEADGWGWDGEDEPQQQNPPTLGKAIDPTPEPAAVTNPEAVAAAPPVKKEKMLVSRRSREIVRIAEEVLVEALTVAEPSFEHPEFAAASAPLLATFVSLLSLYRATAAVHNSTLLASVPAIGMQFANDADWIGREVERVWKSRTAGKALQIAADQASEVEIAIEATRQLGRDTRHKQIAIQRAALMESLDEASGFLRTSDDSRYATCERALQQVTHTLQRLALVWKPVMTPTALYTTLGGLVNEVLLRVLDEIEDQTDISEEESIRLNRLCKMLHELESLFDDSHTSVGREVPIWFKFVFLSELLEASMADILFLFDHGHLVDFSPQEIVRLIRALFSDSPLRNRNVEKILAGHPAIAPEENEEDDWAQPF